MQNFDYKSSFQSMFYAVYILMGKRKRKEKENTMPGQSVSGGKYGGRYVRYLWIYRLQTRPEDCDRENDEIIEHRGPDSEGSFCSDEITLGFRRLSIIDLEDGQQPMESADGNLHIVFNGEIYDYKELREELEDAGISFHTHSDTEVLVNAVQQYGDRVFHKLRGMFGFAVWNEREQSLMLARDFFGIKPVYYAQINGHFVFASEIKSILAFPGYKREVNQQALEQYLSFQYSPLEETFFKGIYKLMPGHVHFFIEMGNMR